MKIQNISFQANNTTLRGDFFEPAENPKSQAVLFLHGWTGRANTNAAALLAENGYYAMTFSLPGHNNSDGDISTLTRAQSEKATRQAIDLFRSLIPDGTPIALVGNSYGGYLAALVSDEPGVNAISLRVPANYPDAKFEERQMGQGHENPGIMEWRRKIQPHTETKTLRAIAEFTGNVQIIEAELDELVPHETVQSYVQAVTDPVKLDFHFMKGWPHSLGADPDRNAQFQEILLTWLTSF